LHLQQKIPLFRELPEKGRVQFETAARGRCELAAAAREACPKEPTPWHRSRRPPCPWQQRSCHVFLGWPEPERLRGGPGRGERGLSRRPGILLFRSAGPLSRCPEGLSHLPWRVGVRRRGPTTPVARRRATGVTPLRSSHTFPEQRSSRLDLS